MLRRFRSFQRGTEGFCRLTGCKDTSCQSWRMTLSSGNQTRAALIWFEWAGGRIFCHTSNFDSLYLCSQLTYRDPQHLFGKIWTSLTYIFSIQMSSKFLRWFCSLKVTPFMYALFCNWSIFNVLCKSNSWKPICIRNLESRHCDRYYFC